MTIEPSDILAHGATGGTSALTAGWFVKTLFKNWVKAHDQKTEAQTKAIDELSKAITALVASVQELKIDVAKISVAVVKIDGLDAKLNSLDKTVAVLDHRASEAEADLNGLGRKIRSLEGS